GPALRLEQRWIAFGVREVVLAHIDALADQRRHGEQEGKLVPDAESIGQCGETSEQPLAKRNGHVAPPLDFALTSMTSWPLRSPSRYGTRLRGSTNWILQLTIRGCNRGACPA